MKRIILFAMAIMMMFSFVACSDEAEKGGDKGESAPAVDSKFVGEWIGVGGDMWGIAMTAEEATAYSLSVSNDGKATLITDGEPLEAKCSSDGEKITLKVEALDISSDGILTDGAILFEDLLGLGIKIYFAQEGTDAADHSLYIPEEDKEMLGTWTSYAVTDILDEDISDTVPVDALVMTFKGDYTVDININGEEISGQTWSLSEGFGYLADSEYDINWDVVDDEIVVSYYDGSDTYKYTCAKS